jgi:hypothetical protein
MQTASLSDPTAPNSLSTPAAPGADAEQDRAPFKLQIAGPDLAFNAFQTADPLPTGRDLVELARLHPIEAYVVLQLLPSGDLEDLRPNETVDLRTSGIERFVIAHSDRTFRLVLVDKTLEWPASPINGITLKRLGNQKIDAVAVFLERQDQPDLEIGDHEFVELAKPGVERFYFRPITQTVSIRVNRKEVQIDKGERTGLEIKQAAINQGAPIQVTFVLTLHKEGGQTKVIGDSDRVPVHEGQRFTAVAEDDVS